MIVPTNNQKQFDQLLSEKQAVNFVFETEMFHQTGISTTS